MSIEDQLPAPRLESAWSRRLVLAGWLCGVVDLFWAFVLTRFYSISFPDLLRSLAAIAFGPLAPESEEAAALLGLVVHFVVAFAWSAVFLALVLASSRLRQALASKAGVVVVAALYGPLVWILMSTVVIPFRSGEPPTIGPRWWIQLTGHAVFVGLPIVWAIGGTGRRRPAPQETG